MKINNIFAKEILNAQGFPTIECEIILENGAFVNSSVPNIQKNLNNLEDIKSYNENFFTNDIVKSIEIINEIIRPEFLNKVPNAIEMDFKMIEMDGTTDKSNFGTNTMLAVSMALYRAHALITEIDLFDFLGLASTSQEITIPIPIINLIENKNNRNIDSLINNFAIIPYGATDIKTAIGFSHMLTNSLKNIIKKNNKEYGISLNGACYYNLNNDIETFDNIKNAINSLNLNNNNFLITINCSLNEFYDNQKNLYNLNNINKTADEFMELYKLWENKYGIFAIKNPFHTNDINSWINLINILGNKMLIVEENLATLDEIAKTIQDKKANTIMIKPIEIGTITETIQAILLCKENGLNTIISNSLNETLDTFIVDLAIGANINYISCGGLNRGEHIAKYNRLLEIENLLSATRSS